MSDKKRMTKKELADALTATEKALVKAQQEAEKGVAEATATIESLQTQVGGHNGDGHVCPRTSMALGGDYDVYATEKRLRSERDAWRTHSGGGHGMRGPEALPQSARVAAREAVREADVIETTYQSEQSLREERNKARRAAGGIPGQRGPNDTDPGKGLSVQDRLRAERDAWLNVTEPSVGPAPVEPEDDEVEIDLAALFGDALEGRVADKDDIGFLAKLIVAVAEEILSN